MEFKRRLPIPKEIKQLYPLSAKGQKIREGCIKSIKDILRADDNRIILLIGPCSADREDAVMEYLGRLKCLSDKVRDKIFIVPRLYTSKPRTSGNAYKGMLHRPDPQSQTDDILKGVLSIRKIHLRALEEIGMGCADEMLYPENHRFISDLLCYVTIGARSADDQQHKLTTSGLDIPVGIKNPLNGDLHALSQDIITAQNPHLFIYRNWEVQSHGNPYAHAILRGYVDHDSVHHQNCDRQSIEGLSTIMRDYPIQNPAIIVDCNHSNSGKDYLKQRDNAIKALELKSSHNNYLKGLMIESYLEDGCQDEHGTIFGKSITDACLGWEKTEKLVLKLADSF